MCNPPLFPPLSEAGGRRDGRFSDLGFQKGPCGPFTCEFLSSSHAPHAHTPKFYIVLHKISRLPAVLTCFVASVSFFPSMRTPFVAMEKIELFNG